MNRQFVECDYCSAEIPIKSIEKKVIEISEKEAEHINTKTDWEKYLEKRNELRQKYGTMSAPPPDNDGVLGLQMFGIIVFITSVIGLAIFLNYSLKSSTQVKKHPERKSVAGQTRSNDPCKNNESIYTFYNVSGHVEKDHIELPEMDTIALPHCDLNRLRRDIFSDRNRIVDVEVILDKKGKISRAEMIKGHEFFRKSAEAAAKKSLFPKQKKLETSVIITYRYLLLE